MQPIADNTSNIPAFLGKLWKMVNDPSTDHLISWSAAGTSFIIQNQAQFWYELLPLYYKHNNMSSFVRQLNMYGFHKISTIDNGSLDTDKDEIQFYHAYFQKDQPELLRNIKRKVTTSKPSEPSHVPVKQDELSKVLTDVKQLKGRQTSVDSQLSAMKQENAVLWRELAILRQKHLKQQQIVNKLIQFLLTLVQPASARMGVSVKRHMPLMLRESPNSKKVKTNKPSDTRSQGSGPTIHELDNEIDILPEEFLDSELTEEIPLGVSGDDKSEPTKKVNSPLTPATTISTTSSCGSRDRNNSLSQLESGLVDESNQDGKISTDFIWDKPEFVDITEEDDPTVPAENLIDTLQQTAEQVNNKIFLNPEAQDTLLSNLIGAGSYNSSALIGKNVNKEKQTVSNESVNNVQSNGGRQIATRDNNSKISNGNGDELGFHLESTQNELDQFKDALNNYTSFDANALIGLFNESPDYGLPNFDKPTNNGDEGNPLVSGNELATCGNNIIDFTKLFDTLEDQENSLNMPESGLIQSSVLEPLQTSLDTPLIQKNELNFPSFS